MNAVVAGLALLVGLGAGQRRTAVAAPPAPAEQSERPSGSGSAGGFGEPPPSLLQPRALVRRSRPMMSTTVTVSVYGCPGERLEAAIAESFATMQRLADQLSEWEPQSAVSQVSAAAGGPPVPVPRPLFEVLTAGQAAAVATDGAFDVTWAALQGLWHFPGASDAAPSQLPAAELIARQRRLVDYRALQLDADAGTARLQRPGMRLGLGGLAKGYIAEAGVDRLGALGFGDALVAASGDLAARGMAAGGRPWRAAIQDPRAPDRVLATVEMGDESLSTAGDYEHAFFIGGQRYHHILDPQSGWPARGTASVSVLAQRGVWADALDTGLLVLGMERGPAVAAGLPAIGALFVGDDGVLRPAGPLAARFAIGAAAVAPRPESQAREPLR